MAGSKTCFVLLGLLAEKPLSGYEMKQLIETRFAYFWNESYGQIYPVLQSLSEQGLVRREESTEARAKVRYSITAAGLNKLQRWLAEPVETEITRYEILLKTYFGFIGSQNDLRRQIGEFRERHQENLAMMDRMLQSLMPHLDADENHRHIAMTILFGQKVFKAYTEWADEAEKMIGDFERVRAGRKE